MIDAVTRAGQLDNTYIFFASDNGFHQGQHRLDSGKNTGYDEDLFVPLVVRGPGVPAGQTVSSITANVDYAPTMGRISLASPFRAPSTAVRSSRFSPARRRHRGARRCSSSTRVRASRRPAPTARSNRKTPSMFKPRQPVAQPIFAGIRTEAKTYIEYDDGERELYDHSSDPNQLNNSYSAANPALVTRLSTWLGNLRHASGADLRAAEESSP